MGKSAAEKKTDKGLHFAIDLKHQKAIKCYDDAIRIDPKYSLSYTFKGDSLSALGDEEGAIRCFNEAISLDPKSCSAYHGKGLALESLGDFDGAIKCYDEAIRFYPKWAKAYNSKGLALKTLGDNEGAIRCFDEVIKLEPKDIDPYNNKGLILCDLGDFDGAIRCFDEVIKLKPNDADTYNSKGFALSNLGDFDGAIICYDEAIRITTSHCFFFSYYSDISAYKGKGLALSNLGDKEGVIRCFDEAIKLKPKDAATYNSKGFALSNLGDFDEAIRCYDEAIKLKPKDIDPYNKKGLALCNLGDFDGAIKYFNKVIQLDPNFANGYSGKGYALSGLGNNVAAVACYDRAIILDPNNLGFYYNKGQALKNLEDYNAAITSFDQAIRLNPKYANAHREKGKLLLLLGKGSEGLESLYKARSTNVASEEGETRVASSEPGSKNKPDEQSDTKKVILKNLSRLTEAKTRSAQEIEDDTAYDELDTDVKEAAKTKVKKLEQEKQKIVDEIADVLTNNQKPQKVKEAPSDASQGAKSQEDDTIAQLLKKMEDITARILDSNKDMDALAGRVQDIKERKASREEVSHAIRINDSEEEKEAQMQEIESDSRLQEYYKGFVSTFSKVFTTSQAVLSGKLTLDTEDIKVTMVSKVVSLVPFCGEVLGSGIEALNDFVKGAGIKNHARKFVSLAPNHSQLDEIVEDVARGVTLNFTKKSLLLEETEATEVSKTWFDTLARLFGKAGMEMKEAIFGDEYESPQAKLGYRDASTLINAFVEGKTHPDNFKDYLVENTNSASQGAIFPTSKGATAKDTKKTLAEGDEGPKKGCCSLMYLTSIKYDDPAIDKIMHESNPAQGLKEHFALIAELGLEYSDLPA